MPLPITSADSLPRVFETAIPGSPSGALPFPPAPECASPPPSAGRPQQEDLRPLISAVETRGNDWRARDRALQLLLANLDSPLPELSPLATAILENPDEATPFKRALMFREALSTVWQPDAFELNALLSLTYSDDPQLAGDALIVLALALGQNSPTLDSVLQSAILGRMRELAGLATAPSVETELQATTRELQKTIAELSALRSEIDALETEPGKIEGDINALENSVNRLCKTWAPDAATCEQIKAENPIMEVDALLQTAGRLEETLNAMPSAQELESRHQELRLRYFDLAVRKNDLEKQTLEDFEGAEIAKRFIALQREATANTETPIAPADYARMLTKRAFWLERYPWLHDYIILQDLTPPLPPSPALTDTAKRALDHAESYSYTPPLYYPGIWMLVQAD